MWELLSDDLVGRLADGLHAHFAVRAGRLRQDAGLVGIAAGEAEHRRILGQQVGAGLLQVGAAHVQV